MGSALQQSLRRAGMTIQTGTVHKAASGKQSVAESSNASAQQGMRRMMKIAEGTFKDHGHSVPGYWDYALGRAALLARARVDARAGKISAAGYHRLARARE